LRAVVNINDVDGSLVVIAIPLFSTDNANIPTEPITEDSRPQPKHFFKYTRIVLKIVRLDNDDHSASPAT
jgi:hypothetical protein